MALVQELVKLHGGQISVRSVENQGTTFTARLSTGKNHLPAERVSATLMFQRAAKGYEGTGIGLAIVRKSVERLGGKVGLGSTEGRGSRFWVELPLADQL